MAHEEAADAAVEQRTFMSLLLEQREGDTHRELSDKVEEIVSAMLAYEKAGSLTLKLKFAIGPSGTVFVSDDIVAKVPEADRSASMFFPDARGGLHRRDPRQLEITGLREAPRPRAAGEE